MRPLGQNMAMKHFWVAFWMFLKAYVALVVLSIAVEVAWYIF